jgi:aspartyl-tRNA(Asn)/glutamyl-tRNA(Gln) amidotransferase subunit B
MSIYPLSATVPAWQAVVGLEVHCQLGTRTKLFCPCAAEFGAPPNTRVCPVCSGAPGSLPVLNGEAVRLALRAALALGCSVETTSVFDRKHYFYCDLPKGYQITQVARPIATGGGIELASGRRVRLARIHLEEDAGKAIHDRGAHTLVDLNRAGVPLIELVSQADLTGAEEAHEFLTRLKETLQFARVSECDMEKGSLRCDVNVSLHRPGEPLGTRVELKNLNSFRHVAAALEHEIARQRELLGRGARVARETRQWEAQRGESRLLRSKESEADYRYFPEPDLPPLVLSEAEVLRERAALPELPAARRQRWQRELGLSEYDARVLCASRALADSFEETARLSGAPKEAANWLANDVAALLAEAGAASPDELRLAPARLADLIVLVATGRVSKSGAKKVLAAMLARDDAPQALLVELGLEQVSDPAAIEAWCRAVLAEQPAAAADVRAGAEKALGALIGRVMKLSGGRAHPELVRATLARLVAGDGP